MLVALVRSEQSAASASTASTGAPSAPKPASRLEARSLRYRRPSEKVKAQRCEPRLEFWLWCSSRDLERRAVKKKWLSFWPIFICDVTIRVHISQSLRLPVDYSNEVFCSNEAEKISQGRFESVLAGRALEKGRRQSTALSAYGFVEGLSRFLPLDCRLTLRYFFRRVRFLFGSHKAFLNRSSASWSLRKTPSSRIQTVKPRPLASDPDKNPTPLRTAEQVPQEQGL